MDPLPTRTRRGARWLAPAAFVVALAACSGDSAGPTSTPVGQPTSAPEPSATPDAPEPSATADASEVVLSWTREGGIAGFCDGLRLTAGHRATLGTCQEPPGDTPDGDLAPDAAIREFETWRGRFASFEIEWDDGPDIADGMTIRLSFVGRGAEIATDEERRQIADFAATLFAEIAAAQQRA